MKRTLFVSCIAILMSLALISGIGFASSPKRGGTLYVAVLQDMWTMDPINIQTTTGERVVHDAGMGECLYDFDMKKGVYAGQ